MSDQWQTVTLEELCRFVGGGAFPKSEQGNTAGQIPFIKVSDLAHRENTFHVNVSNNWIDLNQVQELKAKLMPPGSTVFAKIGEGLKAERLSRLTRETAVDNNLMAATPNESTDSDFLYYLLSTIGLSKWAQGSAIPFLRQKDLNAIVVKVPDLPAQKELAGALLTFDQLIENNRRQIGLLHELVQAICNAVETSCTLSDLASIPIWKNVRPSGRVKHYSLPAFDAEVQPIECAGESIKSNKILVESACALVSRLNPKTPRVWMVYPESQVQNLASTEFVPLVGKAVSAEAIYAITSHVSYGAQMMSLVTGTTGSHQRVDKQTLLKLTVPDVRKLSPARLECITECVQVMSALHEECSEAQRVRNELLQPLVSGQLVIGDIAS